MGLGGDRTLFARLCALVLAPFLSFGWPAQSAQPTPSSRMKP
jgi:hypothetical protein